jgi:ribonuclease T1
MRAMRLLPAVLLAAVLAGCGPAGDAREPIERGLVGEVAVAELPREAVETLGRIRKGGPFPYRKDGTVFGNREGHLPRRPRGYYAEYTVPTPGERDRGARRIVAGRGGSGDFASSGEYYYTADHYNSFRRIRE